MLGSTQLLEQCDVRRLQGATAAGTTTVANTFDMKGYDSALVIVSLSGIVNTAAPVLTLEDGANSGGSDAAAMTDAAGNTIATNAVTLTGTPSTGLLVADVSRPMKRYVTASLARATANVAVDSIVVILYNAQTMLPTSPLTAYLASVNKLSAV